MDNLDFVAHLADTKSTLDTSVELIENFVRSYYQEMYSIIDKWNGAGVRDNQILHAFTEVNAVHQKYWLPETRFIEYWRPSIGQPDEYLIADSGITIFSDMLGNFVANVSTLDGTAVYLLSVTRDELKIVNKFFR